MFQNQVPGNSAFIEKMFEGPETFIIENDSIKRSDIHGEKKFVLAFRSVMIVVQDNSQTENSVVCGTQFIDQS